MRKQLKKTTKEALSSVLPITLIVFVLSVTLTPMPIGTMGLFLFGAVILVVGMGLFTMGADMALIPIGEDMGIVMTKTKRIAIIGIVAFVMGAIITIAEPDLQVLAELVPGIDNTTLIFTVAGGVGLFLLLAVIRILFRIRLSYMLLASYAFIIILSFFVPKDFIAVAFDSGGVTTGPITVPFILSLGLGIASVRADKDSADDSFGLVALASVGPILAVLILGIVYKPQPGVYVPQVIPLVETTRDVTAVFFHTLPEYFKEVAASVWPILAMLLLFQLLTRRYHKRQLLRIFVGFLYTYIGLVLFLTGVNVGFIPVGQSLGSTLASSSLSWLLVPLGALIGYFIVAAEPAVHVLKKQVEEVTGGAIPSDAVQRYLSIGVAASLAIAMLRVLTGISIYWFLIPGYILAMVLTFFVPKIFIGIAFDSGGVVSGPMTSTFLLPFAIGACLNPDRIMLDAFGLVAMVAMTPLIAIQLMGVTYNKKIKQAHQDESVESEEVIEFDDAAEDVYYSENDAIQADNDSQSQQAEKPLLKDDDIIEINWQEDDDASI